MFQLFEVRFFPYFHRYLDDRYTPLEKKTTVWRPCAVALCYIPVLCPYSAAFPCCSFSHAMPEYMAVIINVSASGRNAFSFYPVIIEPNRQRIPAIQNVIDAASIFFISLPLSLFILFLCGQSLATSSVCNRCPEEKAQHAVCQKQCCQSAAGERNLL